MIQHHKNKVFDRYIYQSDDAHSESEVYDDHCSSFDEFMTYKNITNIYEMKNSQRCNKKTNKKIKKIQMINKIILSSHKHQKLKHEDKYFYKKQKEKINSKSRLKKSLDNPSSDFDELFNDNESKDIESKETVSLYDIYEYIPSSYKSDKIVSNDCLMFKKQIKSYCYLSNDDNIERFLNFINNKNINIKQLISFFCEFIPLNFPTITYGPGFCSIFSNTDTDVIYLYHMDFKKINFITWMQNTFKESFTLDLDSIFRYRLNISNLSLKFKLFHFYEYNFIEELLYYGSFTCNFWKSKNNKLCKLRLFNPSYFNNKNNNNNNNENLIIQHIKKNLKNKILTLANFNSEEYTILHKMKLILKCYEYIKLGYTINDPLDVFPGINCMVLNSQSTMGFVKIVNKYLISSDASNIVVEFLSDDIIDPDTRCDICNIIFDTEVDKLPYIRPFISILKDTYDKTDTHSIYCYHGFDKLNPWPSRTPRLYKQMKMHRECFLEVVSELNSEYLCTICGQNII